MDIRHARAKKVIQDTSYEDCSESALFSDHSPLLPDGLLKSIHKSFLSSDVKLEGAAQYVLMAKAI